mmetsp:Transcript_22970/g.42245  ORF Transcript_22970/g.42245 Transcript_22970/m.42245 type:complete len:208 (-) Transcript_22970:42-665(-)
MTCLVLLQDFLQPSLKVSTHSAADAAIIQYDDFLCHCHLVLLEQCIVNRYLPKLVLDYRDLFLLLLPENVIQQRCLAGAQEPCQNGDRKLVLLCFPWLDCPLLPRFCIDAKGVTVLENSGDDITRVDRPLWLFHVPQNVHLCHVVQALLLGKQLKVILPLLKQLTHIAISLHLKRMVLCDPFERQLRGWVHPAPKLDLFCHCSLARD